MSLSRPSSNQSPSWSRPLSLMAGGMGLALAGFGLYVWANCDNVIDDFGFIIRLAKMNREITLINDKSNWSIADWFGETAARYPDKEAIVFVDTGESYSFSDVDARSNQVGNWARAEGIKNGDVVALMMDNRPEFIITWLGLAKIGAVISLINTHVAGAPLVHAFTVCDAKWFVVGGEHAESASAAKNTMVAKKPSIANRWFCSGLDIAGFSNIDQRISRSSPDAIPASVRAGITAASTLMYIYTSGTTGYPKASIISHRKYLSGALGFAFFVNIQPNDRVYTVLPLYHSAGGIGGVGMSWAAGATLVIRKKFSASRFWNDVRTYNCTVLQYIGELCRYLLEVPPTAADGTHNARVMVGNGLRPDIWEAFQTRFKIPQIAELYAATEGNIGLINNKNKVGAVGYIPPLFESMSPMKLVKFDVENEVPIRGEDGYCILCDFNEPGELLGRIDPDRPSSTFEGYTDKSSTEKKVLKDVFEKGDAWFRTGDLLSRDKNGFFYFVDRIGDTFRWKGENVSTNEVAAVVSQTPNVKEANVYGVSIPGRDGKAGMAALRTNPGFDIQALYDIVSKDLPSYARPLFVRILPGMEITATFKHRKVELQKEGFNPSTIDDKLYFRVDSDSKYVPLDAALYNSIVTGALRSKL